MGALTWREGLTVALKAAVGTLPPTLNPLERNPSTPSGLLTGILPGASGTAPRRGTREFLDAYATLPLLRMATSRIADAVSSVQWQLFVVKPKGAPRAIKSVALTRMAPEQRKASLAALKRDGALSEITEHPFLALLDSANSYHTGKAVRKISQISHDTIGEFFWLKERNGLKAPVGIWPIPAHWVIATPTPSNRNYRVSFRGWQGEVPDTEIFWACDLDPAHPYARGTGTGYTLADDLETDKYAALMTKQKFFNHMRPDVLITSPDLNDADTRRLERDWQAKNQGIWNAWKARFLNKEVQVHEFDSDLRANQFVQLRQHERDFVAQVYGVPPEILGIVENSNRATIGAAESIFARYVVIPRLEFWRTNLQERFIAEYDDRLILDYVAPESADEEAQMRAAQAAPFTMSWDEWREKQGLPPLDDGKGTDMYFLTAGTTPTPLEEMLNPPEPVMLPMPGGGGPPPPGGPPKPGARPPQPRPQPQRSGSGTRTSNGAPLHAHAGSPTGDPSTVTLLTTKEWDESEHPREPAGAPDSTGGQFTESGGGGGGGSAHDGGDRFGGKVGGKLTHVPKTIQTRIDRVLEDHMRDYPDFPHVTISDDPEKVTRADCDDTPTAVQDWHAHGGYVLLVNSKWMKSEKALEQSLGKAETAEERALARMRKQGIPPAGSAARIELVRMLGYKGPSYVDPTIEGCIVHELGHVMHDELRSAKQPDFMKAIHDKGWRGKAVRVSLRALDTFDEYVAESFQLYRIGLGNKVEPNLRRAFDSQRAKAAA